MTDAMLGFTVVAMRAVEHLSKHERGTHGNGVKTFKRTHTHTHRDAVVEVEQLE